MKKKRSIFLIAVLLLASTMAGIFGTLAYLQSVTETKKNTFKSDKNIQVLLREPSWDGYEFADPVTQNGEGVNGNYTGSMSNLGFNQAHAYVPGQLIPKNPQIKNSAAENGVSTYVALKVQYFNNNSQEISYAEFKSAYLTDAGIAFDTNWSALTKQNNEKYDVFRYRAALAPGDISSALFTQVPLSINLTTDQNGKLPEFCIKVTAYAIQSDNVQDTNANTLLYSFVTSNN